VDYKFQDKGKFALLTFNRIYVDLPSTAFRLSDGTWVMPGVPVPDLSTWKEWLGSLRIERLQKANLVLFVEESSNNPEILDDVHHRLGNDLDRLFSMVQLRSGITCESADLLRGSSQEGVPRIRQMTQLRRFHQTKGYRLAPITKEYLEDALARRAGVKAMEANRPEFQRAMRGLNILLNGLQQLTGQDRLHQFVRSLEALILPDIGKTEKHFVHRCQTFARAGDDTRALLLEAFAMRSDTEHVNPWDKAMQDYPTDQWEDICLQRTRQMEQLACDAYSRLLRDAGLRDHFRTDAAISAFWKLPDDQRRPLWGKPLDIAMEPLVHNYNPSGSAVEESIFE
jgi:hypothetical protein